MLSYRVYFVGKTISAPPSVYYPLLLWNDKPLPLAVHYRFYGDGTKHSFPTRIEAECAGFNACIALCAEM